MTIYARRATTQVLTGWPRTAATDAKAYRVARRAIAEQVGYVTPIVRTYVAAEQDGAGKPVLRYYYREKD